MASSAIEQALLLLPLVKSHEKDSGDIVERVIQIESGVGEETTTTGWDGAELIAAPFLAAARQGILPVLEKLGTGMYPVKVDISGNIERLEKALQLLGQVQGSLLFNVVRKELQCNQHTDSKSATKALLWLKRALDFTVGMIKLLVENPEMEVSIAAEMTYTEKLKPFHGWITQGAFSMALRYDQSQNIDLQFTSVRQNCDLNNLL